MENPAPSKVASRIEADRLAAGIAVSDLALESGIAAVTLYRRLNGDDNLTVGELVKLGNALHKPISVWVAA